MKRAAWMNTGNMGDLVSMMLSHVDPNKPLPARLPKLIQFLIQAPKAAHDGTLRRVDRARDIVAKLGLNRFCQEAVYCIAERWDGRGYPESLRGTFIPLTSRILMVAMIVDLFDIIEGREGVEKALHARRSHQLDSEIVNTFSSVATDQFWLEFQNPELRQVVIDMEPESGCYWIDHDRLDSVIEAFADAVDVKSPWTGLHSTGVAMVAERLARRLALSDDEVRKIRRAALLHDLGKMSVPNSILDKPGKLEPSEWERMRLHPYYTERILEHVEAFQDLALIAGAHHECLDGSGYPHGLKGQEIPLGARILSVADRFHALSEDRPYRSRMETSAILDTMSKAVGPQIDPDIFAALKSML